MAPSGQSLVCFQAYNNASCGTAVGPKQCSAQGRARGNAPGDVLGTAPGNAPDNALGAFFC